MIYLDNATTTFPKPAAVAEAMHRYMTEVGVSPGRGGHRLTTVAQAVATDVRHKLAQLIRAPDDNRIIFTASCTDALNMAIKGVLNEGDHVVTTALEHNSVQRPLEALFRAGFIDLVRVGISTGGFVDPDDVARAMTRRTRLVVLNHASNVIGTIQPATEIGAIAREHGALFLLDAAQTIGILDIDCERMHVDLMASAAHKSLFGPPGLGVLFVGERADVRPWREGGTGEDATNPLQPRELPVRLEAGTCNGVGIAGLQAALSVLTPEKTLAHERRLTRQTIETLESDDRFTLLGDRDPQRRVGTVSVRVSGLSAQEVAAALDESFGIAVRAGLHCAPQVHRSLGTFPDGTVRIAPGPFNTVEDITRTCEALGKIAQ